MVHIYTILILFKSPNLFTIFNWDYDVYNDAKNNKDLVKTAFHCVEVQLQNIYNIYYYLYMYIYFISSPCHTQNIPIMSARGVYLMLFSPIARAQRGAVTTK